MDTSLQVQERWIGPDLVRIEGDQLVIYSPRHMPEWVVREFCQPTIWFEDQRFYLRARTTVAGPRPWKYALSPWTQAAQGTVPNAIFYSAEYVAERERDFRAEQRGQFARALLLPCYPLLGFLWSGTKDHLERFGFVSRSITSISLGLQLGVVALFGIFVGYLGYGSGSNYALLLVLVLDLVMRYDALLREEKRPLGFLEWCRGNAR